MHEVVVADRRECEKTRDGPATDPGNQKAHDGLGEALADAHAGSIAEGQQAERVSFGCRALVAAVLEPALGREAFGLRIVARLTTGHLVVCDQHRLQREFLRAVRDS